MKQESQIREELRFLQVRTEDYLNEALDYRSEGKTELSKFLFRRMARLEEYIKALKWVLDDSSTEGLFDPDGDYD